MSTDIENPPAVEEVDKTFPAQEADDGSTEILHEGKGLKRSSFADTLDKKAKEPKTEKVAKSEDKQEAAAPKADAGEAKDPIAEKIAEKKAESTEEKPKSLLGDALKKAEDAKAKKKEEAPAKDAKAETKEPKTITDADIEEELKNPHRSETTQERIRYLANERKRLMEKDATTSKQLAEKEAKISDVEKKLSEAGRAAGVAPEVQAQLDELQQYRRQYQVENSPEYKKFDDAYVQAEQEVLSTLKNAGVKLKGQTWEQTEAYIKEVGGYSAFQKKHPEIARQIREDVLEVADSDEVQAAVGRQKLLKKAQEAFLDGEKKQAKEYFSKIEADKKAAAEAAPKPEAERQTRKAKLEQWRDKTIAEVELFKDTEAPAEASDEMRMSIKQQNELKAFLRSNLASNLNLDNEEDVARVALDATLAHFFKKQADGLYAENEQLRSELKKVKTAGKTIIKGTQAPAPVSEKPAKTFEEQLERSLARKGA